MTRDSLSLHVVEAELDPYVEAMAEFEEAAEELELEPWIVERLKNAEREVALNLSYELPGCERALATGFRVLHNSARGPGLGALVIDPAVSLNQVRASALKSTWQCGLFDLPFGGSAGALLCDPEVLSEAELRSIVQAYMEKMGGMISRVGDIIVPQRGSNEKLAAWMMESCGRHGGVPDFGTVTGKPEALWGVSSQGITAFAVGALLGEILAARGGRVERQNIVIQGFGATGCAIAGELGKCGARIVGLADLSGALYQERGMDLQRVQRHFQEHRILYGYPEADAVCNADLLEAPGDILILAAAENQIASANAEHIRAEIVIEGVENGIGSEAWEILRERGVLAVPEILAGGGALLAAFLEWMQGVRFCRLSAGEMQQAVKARVGGVWRDLQRLGGKDLRREAVWLGVSRVADTMRALG